MKINPLATMWEWRGAADVGAAELFYTFPTCNNTLEQDKVHNAPLSSSFTHIATLFDSDGHPPDNYYI